MIQHPAKGASPGIWNRFFGKIGRMRADLGPASYFYSNPRFVWMIAERGESAFYVWLGRRQVIRLVIVTLLIVGGIWILSNRAGP